MLTKAEKDVVIKDVREKILSSKALFVTNLVGIESNSAVAIRKSVREAKGTIVVTKNSLFEKAALGTYAEGVLKGLKGTTAVAFAFEDAPAVAKVIFEANKTFELVKMGEGYLSEKPLTKAQVVELAKLPSRDQMLGTLLATFNAPISAFARLMNVLKDECEAKNVTSPSGLLN
jgi:large subunit ribosomal protein L10